MSTRTLTHVMYATWLDDVANWPGSRVFGDMAPVPTRMSTWIPRNATCLVTWHPCQLGRRRGDNVTPRNAYIIDDKPRHSSIFTTSLNDYIIRAPTSRPKWLTVRYNSSVITQKIIVDFLVVICEVLLGHCQGQSCSSCVCVFSSSNHDHMSTMTTLPLFNNGRNYSIYNNLQYNMSQNMLLNVDFQHMKQVNI
jgi:hypothetical protein